VPCLTVVRCGSRRKRRVRSDGGRCGVGGLPLRGRLPSGCQDAPASEGSWPAGVLLLPGRPSFWDCSRLGFVALAARTRPVDNRILVGRLVRACTCELDHERSWASGGHTNEPNILALCCRHHHGKHDAGSTPETTRQRRHRMGQPHRAPLPQGSRLLPHRSHQRTIPTGPREPSRTRPTRASTALSSVVRLPFSGAIQRTTEPVPHHSTEGGTGCVRK
jgi:hypothetical protein